MTMTMRKTTKRKKRMTSELKSMALLLAVSL
jgi:hypothetical protein